MSNWFKQQPSRRYRSLPTMKYPKEEGGTDTVNFWGLDSLDFTVNQTYVSDYTGKNVNVYILDSGLDPTHPGFKPGQAKNIWSRKPAENEVLPEGDCEGHGSHLAGIVGGKIAGVARNANIHMLRIMDCQSKFSTTTLIEALTHLKDHIQSPALINLSIGSEASTTLETAIPPEDKKSITKLLNHFTQTLKIPIIVSAGNKETDQCDPVYEDVKDLIVVGSVNKKLELSDFSNYGKCVLLYGPGEDIWSHSNVTTGMIYARRRGTSQAAPFVTGVSALLMEMHQEQIDPTTLKQMLLEVSDKSAKVRGSLLPYIRAPLIEEIPTATPKATKKKSGSSVSTLSQISKHFNDNYLPWTIGLSVGIPLFVLSLLMIILAMKKRKKKPNKKASSKTRV